MTQEEYKQQILASQIILPNYRTLVLEANGMEMVTALTEKKRTEFIEYLCGSQKLIESYHQLVTQEGSAKLKFDFIKKEEEDLKAEKRKISKDIESVEKRMEMAKDFNEQVQQFSLFRLYHNGRFEESVELMIDEERKVLDETKGKREENFEGLKTKWDRKSELEENFRSLDKKLQGMIEERNKLLWNKHKKDAAIENLKKSDEVHEILKAEVKKIQGKIDDANAEIQKLQDAYNNLLPHKSAYDQLAQTFKVEKLHIESQKLHCGKSEEKVITDEIKRYEESLEEIREELNTTVKEMNTVKASRDEKFQEIRAIEERSKVFENIKENLTKIESKIHNYNKSSSFTSSPKTLVTLQQKFPSHILGRLSQLWTVNGDESDKKFIEKRLGKFSEAIVVDNKETAQACISFLKIKQLTDIDEIFLPLSEFSSQEPNNVKIPRNFPARKIESLVKCESKDVEKALLHCLTQSIVCETLKVAEKAITMQEFKKINVMSEGAECFTKEGFLQVSKKLRDSSFSIVDAEQQQLIDRGRYMRLKITVDEDVLKLGILRRKLDDLDEKLEFLQTSANAKKGNFDFYNRRLKKFQKDLETFNSNEDLAENIQKLNKLQDKESEFYAEFCESVGVSSIADFLEVLDIISKIASVRKRSQPFIEDLSRNQEMLDNTSPVTNVVRSETEKILKVIDELNEAEMKIDEQVEENIAKEMEIFELSKEIHESEERDKKFLQEVVDSFEKIYDDLNKVQENFTKNYEIIMRHFMEQMPMPLKTGTMRQFVMPAEDLPEGYHLVKDQLKL
jgi:chromosome segregation ATPase